MNNLMQLSVVIILFSCASQSSEQKQRANMERMCSQMDRLNDGKCLERLERFRIAAEPTIDKYEINANYCLVTSQESVAKPVPEERESYTWQSNTGESGTISKNSGTRWVGTGSKSLWLQKKEYQEKVNILAAQCLIDKGWPRGSDTLKEQLISIGEKFGLDAEPLVDQLLKRSGRSR